MDAVSVLAVVGKLVEAREVSDLMSALICEVRARHHIPTAVFYRRDVLGERLHAVAAQGVALQQLPELPRGEQDNPLWFCMQSRKAYFIEQVSALLGGGEDFEVLGGVIGVNQALLTQPLFDIHGQAMGVLLFCGEANALQAWRLDKVWGAIMAVSQCLLTALMVRQHGADGHAASLASTRRSHAAQLLSREFVGQSKTALRLRNELLLLSGSELSVLVTGETGVGKDHAAWLIHRASARCDYPFVAVNCAAIPRDLIEAELFGCTRGAFTGATQAREGLVANADGGTLFLDEIGDMPLDLQGTLLRLLNEKRFRPVGSVQERASDFRLICATHQPLPSLVREGRFRQDLYFRICQSMLVLPPLRARQEDLGSLIASVIAEYNRRQQRHVLGIGNGALQLLASYSFPGNIRELRNVVLAACERTACGRPLEQSVLCELLRQFGDLQNGEPTDMPVASDLVQALMGTDNLPQAVETFERLLINARLWQSGGSRRRAAESLGMPKRTLARKCRQWGLDIGTND